MTTHIQKAIERAIEGGYYVKPLLGLKGRQEVVGDKIVTYGSKQDGWERTEYEKISDVNFYKLLLDPAFWQSLGEVEGWCKHEKRYPDGECVKCSNNCELEDWLYYWHRFIDHLASGKDADSFFADLLNNK